MKIKLKIKIKSKHFFYQPKAVEVHREVPEVNHIENPRLIAARSRLVPEYCY